MVGGGWLALHATVGASPGPPPRGVKGGHKLFDDVRVIAQAPHNYSELSSGWSPEEDTRAGVERTAFWKGHAGWSAKALPWA